VGEGSCLSVEEKLCMLLAELEPVQKRRVLLASTRAPERLPREMEILELIIDLRRKVCA
jgi:hypothetical protein